MLRQTQNTAMILNNLKEHSSQRDFSITWHSDGFSIGRWSLRLSNAPLNLSRMSSFLFGGAAFLLHPLMKADAYEGVHFQFKDTIYELELTDKVIYDDAQSIVDNLKQGSCQVVMNIPEYSLPGQFEKIRMWIGWNGGIDALAYLSRGSTHPVYKEAEHCISSLIEASLDNGNYKLLHGGTIALAVVGVIGGIGLIMGTTCYVQHRRSMRRHNRLTQLEGGEESESLLLNDSLQANGLFKHEPIKLTLAERLEAIGITDLDDFPEAQHFICPVNQTIMENPALTDDGHNYEFSVLEKLKNEGANCPLNSTIKVKTIISNHDLRREIIEFVEKQEKLAKEKPSQPKIPQDRRIKLNHSI